MSLGPNAIWSGIAIRPNALGFGLAARPKAIKILFIFFIFF
jgi:hypothetical protein